MALEGTDLLVVQKQSGNNDIRSLSISNLSTFISNTQPITFKGTANGTIAGEEPDAANHVDGFLFINDAASAGDFAWTAGTSPFSGTIYPNASIIWQTPTGWQVTNNKPAVDVGVTVVQGSLPITVNSDDDPSAPIVGVNAAATDGSASGVVTIATDQDVAAGTAGKVVTSAQLKQTNDNISNAGGGTVTNVIGVDPIEVADGTTSPSISIKDAGVNQKGAVALVDDSDIDADGALVAATPKYVDSFYLLKDFSDFPSVDDA